MVELALALGLALSNAQMADIRGMGSNAWVWDHLWTQSYPDPWGPSIVASPAYNTYNGLAPNPPQIPGSLQFYPAPVHSSVLY